VTLHAEDGLVGNGEAAPLPDYDGVTIDDTLAAIADCQSILDHADRTDREQVLAQCAQIAVLPQAMAAIDVALWDLEGRRVAQPVWRLLDATASPAPIEVNATVARADRAGAAAETARIREDGFRCIKAKVGIGDDAGRLAAIRAVAGPDVALRIDANGAWSVDEARASLRALAPVRIELCEEPVRGLDAIRQLAPAAPVAIAIDETARQQGALDERACDAVCLKIGGCGGISGVLDAARRARAVGYEVYLASTYDGPLGIAAALHAAAAIRPDRPCGLATLSLFDAFDPLPVRGGRISPPAGAGLGDGLVDWYSVA
jgi:L-alanine-DL-glutamate epimerase-like enolase superfamily enzyme